MPILLNPYSPDEAAILSSFAAVIGSNSRTCGGSNGAAMGDLTGEADKGALRLDFDHRLLPQFRGSSITSIPGCWLTASWTVVGEGMELETNGVGGEAAAR
jgi:hypothetical protein